MNIVEGFAVEFKGQLFRCVGTHLHTNKSGLSVEVVDWETDCPECGVTFALFTLKTFKEPRRRCDMCKSPGRAVKRK